MAVPPPLSKPALRTALRAQRRAHRAALLTAGDLAAAEAAIAAGLLVAVPPGAVVALHQPHGDEPAFSDLAAVLAARGHALALPALDGAGAARFAVWSPDDPLMAGPFGPVQPAADTPDASPDLIVAPLVGFDRRGGRLGQGGGHYDRLFARYPAARRVGCAWGMQEVPDLPLDEWDVALHAIVTEIGPIDCGEQR